MAIFDLPTADNGPLANLTFSAHRSSGAALARPGSFLYLNPTGSVKLCKGQVLVRSDVRDVFDVVVGSDTRYLYFIRGIGDSPYQLVFRKDTLRCVATSMTDVSSTKAIGFLDILETLESAQLPNVAYEFTNHYSPIVRWRALSSMNKTGHSKTGEVLRRLCYDKVEFVREGAKRALEKGN